MENKDIGAKKKIHNIIDTLKPEEKNGRIISPNLSKQKIDIIRTEINMIGDSVLRRQLIKMLRRCESRDEKESLLDKRISDLELQLMELRELRDKRVGQ